jgi:hypothetical protein
VLDHGEKPAPEEIGQHASIDAVILVSRFDQRIHPRITHHNLRNVRLAQVAQPRRAGSFLIKVMCKFPENPQEACRMAAGFVSGTDSIIRWPVEFRTTTEIVAY